MIKYIKLVDGDEIIGDVNHDLDAKYSKFVVYNPLQIVTDNSSSEQVSIFMTDYITYTAGNNVSIPKTSIVWMGSVSEEILEYYYVALEFVQKNHRQRVKDSIINATNLLRLSNDGHTMSLDDEDVIINNATKH